MKPATVQVPVEEWELIEKVIETSIDRLRLMSREEATQKQKLDAITKSIKAITKLAEYKGAAL